MPIEYKYLDVKKNGAILEVLLNRPEKRNAFNRAMYEEFSMMLDQADDDAEIRAVALRGNGTVFSAGGDLEAGAPGYVKDGISTNIPRYQIPHLPRAWYLRKALVAGVHGYIGPAVCNILACCDVIIAAEGTKFSFETNRTGGENANGSILSMHIPLGAMKRLFILGGWFDAERARDWDLVQRVVPLKDLPNETNRWAAEFCKIPVEQIKASKEAVHRIYELKGLINVVGVGNRVSGHGNPEDRAFYATVLEKGMREAVKTRDTKFDPDIAKV